MNKARTDHYTHTLPWFDSGPRVLSSVGYFKYQKVYQDNLAAVQIAVASLGANWDQLVSDAEVILNGIQQGLFDPAEYPTATEITTRFGMSLAVDPMPTTEDFRLNLAASEVQRIEARMRETGNRRLAATTAELWTRLQSVVQHMSDRLQAYSVTPEGKVQSPFRDSLVSNITELLDLIPSLNLTNDPMVDQFAEDIRATLVLHTPAELRDSQTTRECVARTADDILARMSEFVA
jgi:hypothetical protein